MNTRKPGIDAATQAVLDKAGEALRAGKENMRRIHAGLSPLPRPGEGPAPRLDAATQATMDRARATSRDIKGRVERLIDENSREADELERDTRKVVEVLSERNREETRATHRFRGEVDAENRLLKEQEARWAEEDRKAGRK